MWAAETVFHELTIKINTQLQVLCSFFTPNYFTYNNNSIKIIDELNKIHNKFADRKFSDLLRGFNWARSH